MSGGKPQSYDDGFADIVAKQEAGEKPPEMLLVVMRRKVDAELFGIQPTLFQLDKIGHRRFVPVRVR
jgi:hypothetical protein